MCSRPRRSPAAGFTLVELAVVMLIIGVLVASATAMLFRARGSANEASAISAMRSINVAQVAYASSCGHGYFATGLPSLAVPPGPADSQGYLPSEFRGGNLILHSGYRISVGAGRQAVAGAQKDCNGRPTQTTYYASAVPQAVDQTGSASFATNNRGTIYKLPGALAPAEPLGPPATPVQ